VSQGSYFGLFVLGLHTFVVDFPVRELCLPRRDVVSQPERTMKKSRRANARHSPRNPAAAFLPSDATTAGPHSPKAARKPESTRGHEALTARRVPPRV
jgi:hypothetical protein